MTLGFADSAFASTPFGLGTPATIAEPPDPPDRARYVSPIDRDYLLDADGNYERMPETRQRVLLALMSDRNLPRKIDQTALTQIRQSVANALAFLVREGTIRIDGVTIESDKTGRLIPTVQYEDLRSGATDNLEF